MVMENQIESTVDGLSEPVGAAAFVAEWLATVDGRRLPGERGRLYFRTYVLRLSFAECASVSFVNLVTSAPFADCSPGASINNPNIRAYSLVTRSDSAGDTL